MSVRPEETWFWAKLGTATWPEEYHPLAFHLYDVGLIARGLWERVLREPLRQRVARPLGLGVEDAGRWVAFWIAAHDIGKLSPGFQLQGNTGELKNRLLPRGFTPDGIPAHHATVSTAVLAAWLTGRKIAAPLARHVGLIVGGHHGTFHPLPADGTRGPRRWKEAQTALLDDLASRLSLPASLPAEEAVDDPFLFAFLAGFTSVADWIGSNRRYFPPAGTAALADTDPNTAFGAYAADAEQAAGRALEDLGWVGRRDASSSNPPPFAELFAYLRLPGVRPLQEVVANVAATLESPGLILVEAPMGEGKTEAALYAAEVWDRRGGQGAYVALPTMATSNGMFGRVKQYLEVHGRGRVQLHLLHGQAALSPVYESLGRDAHAKPYRADLYDDPAAPPSDVVADAWFAHDRRQALLAPFGVGTIDQALLGVLGVKHFFVRLFGLAGKMVILDEVHAYDTYTGTLLDRLVEWLAALGCPVVLLSATLPRKRREQLLKAYAGADASVPCETGYPRVSVVRPGRPVEEHKFGVDALNTKTPRLDRVPDDLPALAARIGTALAGGGRACVIRNTVGKAQETYLALRDHLAPRGVVVELFHARFPFGRRQEIEAAVLRDYGKGDRGSPPPDAVRPARVLVATQVVEQSLDLDFDLMVSDLAPIDLILQRIGRLHRHRRERPAGLRAPTLWLFGPGQTSGVPDFGHSESVYSRYVLLRTSHALAGRRTIDLPSEIEPLIEAVYDPDEPAGISPAFATALAEAGERERQEDRDRKKKARAVVAPKPARANEILDDVNPTPDEDDDPRTHASRKAATRDADPTVQLVVLYHRDGRAFLSPHGEDPLDLAGEPDIALARRLLRNAVTVSHPGCVAQYARTNPPSGWSRSGLLRFHRVVAVDTDGTSLAGEFPLTVCHELGLRFTRDAEREL